MATTVGDVAIRVGADIGPLQRNMKKGGRTLDGFGRQAATTAKRVGAITAAVTAVSAVIATKMVKSTLAAVDAQAKLARQLDGTIDGLRAVQIAGSDAGVETGVLNKAMEKLTSRLGEAMEGTGEAAKALEMLGLNAKDLAEMDIDDRISAIADRMNEMNLSAAEAGNALRDLGIRNGEIINLMRQGGDAISAAKDELRAFGLSISEIDAAKIEKANDAMTRIGFAGEAISQAFTVELAPSIEAVANEISRQFKDAGNDMREGIGGAVDFGVTKLADLIRGAAAIAEFVESNQEMAKFGLMGFLLFGKKGAAIGSVVGLIIKEVEEFAQRFGVGISDAEHDFNKMDKLTQEMGRRQQRVNELTEEYAQKRAEGLRITELQQIVLDKEKETIRKLDEEREAIRSGLEVEGTLQEQINEILAQQEEKTFSIAENLRGIADALTGSVGADGDSEGGSSSEIENAVAAEEEKNQALLQTQQEYQERSASQYMSFLDDRVNAAKEASEAEKAIAQAEFDAKMNIASKGFGNLATLMETESRELFNIGKAAAIAQATIDGYQATVSAYRVGSGIGGPVVGAAFAATAATATGVQIAKLANTQYGGGGSNVSAPSGGGGDSGAGAQQQQPQAPQEPDRVLRLESVDPTAFVSGAVVNQLAEQLVQYQKDGFQLVVS